MRPTTIAVTAALAAIVGGAGIALASGGPPPSSPSDPPVFTVVASGAARRPVVAPAQRSDLTIEHAVRRARAAAMPSAVASARAEATQLAVAGGLRLGPVVGIRRETQPYGYYSEDEGRFGPGGWCGRLYVGRRRVKGADGRTRSVSRFRTGCVVPKRANIRVIVTFAAEVP